MTVQNMTVAARKTGDKWEAALVIDGKFMRAFTGEDGGTLASLVGLTVTAALSAPRNEGTEIGINITVAEPDAK